MISSRTACVAAITVALGFLSACEDSKTSGPETVAPTDSAAPATDPPTTPAPTTIEPTTLAPTTTVAPAAFLREDGLGAFDFGDSYEDAIAGMPLTVRSDDAWSYPVARDGLHLTTDEEYWFSYPSAREVCWDDGVGNTLCAHFGGADLSSLGLVGWEYGGGDGSRGVVGPLLAASGAGVYVLMSDVPTIPPIQGECYGWTQLFLDGILLTLQAPSNEEFGTTAADGTYTLNVPAPAGWIAYLIAGEQRGFEGGDAEC